MPIPLPNLDDRRWADLVEQGRALIPVYAPEWTNHNASDPGITLMELFAWITEGDIYRANRITDASRLKFLALAGLSPQPPKPAQACLSVQLAPQEDSLPVPEGAEFSGADLAGVSTRFRSLATVDVVQSSIQSVQAFDGTQYHPLTGRSERGEPLELFGSNFKTGATLYLGFTKPLPTAIWASLAFLAGGDQLATPHHSARTVWETLANTPGSGTQWISADAQDSTRSLTQTGTVRLKPTAPMLSSVIGSSGEKLYYARVRFVSGAYDAVPVAKRIVMNAIEVEQSVWAWEGALQIGEGTGSPHQAVKAPGAPVEQATFELQTIEPAGARVWERREDFDSSGPADAHYLLNSTTGEVLFGDGQNGRVPPDGCTIVARYRTTRGAAGNLPPGKIDQLAVSARNHTLFGDIAATAAKIAQITNPLAASGGADAETLASATGRAIVLREAPLRAVTLSDFEALALATPGTRIARVTALANVHPAFGCMTTPGIVTVLIVPYLPAARPIPSAGLRSAVAAQLEARRIIGTRVEVAAPEYLEVAVLAKVKPLAGVAKARLKQTIIEALNRFLDPLNGGPEYKGWPFGRDVFRSEVFQAIDDVPGVDYVTSLELLADGCGPLCGNICLRPTWLITPGQHEIEVL